MEKKIIVCRGLPASGKSTFAKKWVSEDPEHRIRLNYDNIRSMFGGKWSPKYGEIIHEIRNSFLTKAIDLGFEIIIDNLNLNPKDLAFYQGIINAANSLEYSYSLEIKDFKVPLDECIERDSKRENPIGVKVITDLYNQYKNVYNL